MDFFTSISRSVKVNAETSSNDSQIHLFLWRLPVFTTCEAFTLLYIVHRKQYGKLGANVMISSALILEVVGHTVEFCERH